MNYKPCLNRLKPKKSKARSNADGKKKTLRILGDHDTLGYAFYFVHSSRNATRG